MRRIAHGFVLTALAVGASSVFADATLDFRRLGNVPLTQVQPNETLTVELWLKNQSALTVLLSAYLFDFQGGDFATGRLGASNWQESSAFAGLNPPWIPVDLSLNTGAADYSVSGVTGSLQTPFVGPAVPLNTPVLIGMFDVIVNADPNSYVDFLLNKRSGLDDQDGNLAGGGLASYGVVDVFVTPEPTAFCYLIAISVWLCSSRMRRKTN